MNPVQNKQVIFRHLGEMDYQEAWDYQTRLFEILVGKKLANRKRKEYEMIDNYLLFCQHPHVYTLGKSGDEQHLLLNETELKKRHATFYRINRGGDITYHGPGQIVGYPVIDLENFFTDIHTYLRLLEEAVIATLAEYNITAGRIKGLTGVWITEGRRVPGKICALGVKASRWVTMHGFAFNVNTDLSYFDGIVPCGIDNKEVTSMERELGAVQDLPKVEQKLLFHLIRLFNMDLIPVRSTG